MKVISLSRIVDEGAYIGGLERKLSGALEDPEKFLENLVKVQLQYRGVFAFFAFHYETDTAVAEYIAGGSLAPDAGPDVLALFLTKNGAHYPRELAEPDLDLGVVFDSGSYPAYEFLQLWFPADIRPTVPGMILFDRLSHAHNAVYVPLAGLNKDDLPNRCRSIFQLVARNLRYTGSIRETELDYDAFARALDKAEIEYVRVGDATLKGHVNSGIAWLTKHREQIVSAIHTGVKIAGKFIPGAPG